MISCLMVTQPGRESMIAGALQSFDRQDFTDRELVVVHDGGQEFDGWIRTRASSATWPNIRVIRSETASLGKLRNRSVAEARGAFICQWDDDDLSHPARLSLQFERLRSSGADFCLLTDQLHLFTEERLVFWDDWSVETWPGNLIQGTLLGRRAMMPAYHDKPVGEDTNLLREIVNNGHRMEGLADHGWMHIYQYHGENAWDSTHHKTISRWKRRGFAQLETALPLLERTLPEYQLPYESVSLLHERGKFTIAL